MKYSKHKEELNNELSSLLGILMAVKTKETNVLEGEHWLNYFIDKISSLKYQILDDKRDCTECNGDGADYPTYAESILDAVACPVCDGYGFSGRQELQNLFSVLKQKAYLNKNESIINKINLLTSLPLFS